MMYDELCINAFLENQLKLFPEKVAETPEEAEEFLEDCMAVVCKNIGEVKRFLEEEGLDITGMSEDDFAQMEEVFPVVDGRFLIVEG